MKQKIRFNFNKEIKIKRIKNEVADLQIKDKKTSKTIAKAVIPIYGWKISEVGKFDKPYYPEQKGRI